MVRQKGDCQKERERRVLGQGRHMGPGLGRGRVWGLDTGSRCGLVRGRSDELDIVQRQVLDTSEDPDTDRGWGPARGRSGCHGPGWTWGCWERTGTGNRDPFQRGRPSSWCREHL